MPTRFRGIDRREGMLVEGAGRLGRVQPVPRLRRPRERAVARRCARLRRARVAGARTRRRSRSTAPCPPSAPSRRSASSAAAAARPPRSRSPSRARPSPRTSNASRRCATRSARRARSASTPTAAGPSTRRSARSRRSTSPPTAWSTSSSPAPRSRTSPPYAARSACRSPPTSRSAGPTTRSASSSSRPPTSRCSRSQPLGGVHACLRIAEQIGLPVVVSSAVETSIGLAAGLALAGALPELPYACGLATTSLLAGDVVAEPLKPVDGFLPVGRQVLDPVGVRRGRRRRRDRCPLAGAAVGRTRGAGMSASRGGRRRVGRFVHVDVGVARDGCRARARIPVRASCLGIRCRRRTGAHPAARTCRRA